MRSMHTALLSNIYTTVQILHETIQQFPLPWSISYFISILNTILIYAYLSNNPIGKVKTDYDMP